jgi:hypothetical protein
MANHYEQEIRKHPALVKQAQKQREPKQKAE